MKFPKARPRPLNNPEVALNLWAYTDGEGYILRLAGKAYVVDGSDEEKLAQLHSLSATDFLSATWQKVPENFTITNAEGREMHGVAHASMISDESAHSVLFRLLIDELERLLPEQVRSFEGTYVPYRPELPESPLCVTTLVMEYDDGRLEAMLS